MVYVETYRTMGREHTEKDEEVSWGTVGKAQRELKGHMRFVNKIFNVGEGHGKKSQERTRKVKELKSTIIPILSLLIKDHKECKDGDDPKTRPVCHCSRSVNGELSESLAYIIEACNDATGTNAAIST